MPCRPRRAPAPASSPSAPRPSAPRRLAHPPRPAPCRASCVARSASPRFRPTQALRRPPAVHRPRRAPGSGRASKDAPRCACMTARRLRQAAPIDLDRAPVWLTVRRLILTVSRLYGPTPRRTPTRQGLRPARQSQLFEIECLFLIETEFHFQKKLNFILAD